MYLGNASYECFLNSMFNYCKNDNTFGDIKFPIQNLKNANFILGPGASDADFIKLRGIVERHIAEYCGDIKKYFANQIC